MKKEYLTANPSQIKKLGKKFAREILKTKLKKTTFVIGLTGELGGGKTTFLQGFAKGLGIKEKILSPTFIIYKKFQIPNSKFQINSKFYFYHFDCYRIKEPKELLYLGFKEITSSPKNIVAVEWSDKIKKIMPKNAVWINFEFINEKKRRISIIMS